MRRIINILCLLVLTFYIASACSPLIVAGATANPLTGTAKEGVAKDVRLFGFIPIGEAASIENAASKAGITNVQTVHIQANWWILGTTYRTIVRGD